MQSILRYLSLGLNVFLVFILAFRQQLQLPAWLQLSGKLHPVVLHIPIGILVMFALFHFLFKNQINTETKKTFLLILSISAAFAALFGFFLGQEGYEDGQLDLHRNTGVIFSVLSYLAFAFYEHWSKNVLVSNIALTSLLGLMTWVGHQGGSITHGENFLSFSSKAPEVQASTVFDAQIMPIFKAKCLSCHNDAKTKGGLNMSTIAKLIKGGKNGPIWKAGDIIHSKFLARAILPIEDKEHMPPKGREQLSEDEIKTLSNWVKEGALSNQKLSDLKPSSFFYSLTKTTSKPEKIYAFSSVSADKIEKLSTPFLYLSPLSSNSPALKANFFVKANFKLSELEKLKEISEQIVSIDLSKMPVGDEVFPILANFKNLEHVNLNQTNIKGVDIGKLSACKSLESISMANTSVSIDNLKPFLQKSKPLQVYLWSTAINPDNIKGLKHRFDFGYVPVAAEVLQLNPPTLLNQNMWFANAQTLNFKHTLKGVKIKYALNDEVLDSLKSKEFTSPLPLNTNTKIRVMAVKDGWKSSQPQEFTFFKSIIVPLTANANTQPDRAYGLNTDFALKDRNLATISNVRDPNFLGYQYRNMDHIFTFKPNTKIEGLTMSYAAYTNERVFPPESIEVYIKVGGGNFVLIKKEIPAKSTPTSLERRSFELSINKSNVEAIRVVAKPLSVMPAYLKDKPGAKPWFFTDEIFFF